MNMILIENCDLTDACHAVITGRRFDHIKGQLRKKTGDECKCGLLNGNIGAGRITRLDADSLTLELKLTEPPPPVAPLTLVSALPRPKTLRKMLHYAGTLGVKEFHFIGTFKVEKSYWDSPFLEPDFLNQEMRLALEQCVDTVPWQIHFHRFFKPFAEDILPGLAAGKELLAFHPAPDADEIKPVHDRETIVCLGPEGGFTDYEIQLLTEQGAKRVSLGPRILRSEVALSFLLGKLL